MKYFYDITLLMAERKEIEIDPIKMAELVFADDPVEPKSYAWFSVDEKDDSTSNLELFEIFLTIMTEGILIKTPNITKETLKLFNENNILMLRPWLHSLGYDVDVSTCKKQEKELYDDYYCKVILRCDPEWNTYFEMHSEITKDYHFILGGNSQYVKHKIVDKRTTKHLKELNNVCHLNNLFAVFIANKIVYKLRFKCL